MSDLWVFMLIWGVWILIPIVIDGVETLIRLVVIVFSRLRKPENIAELSDEDLPHITVIVPAYNEEKIINRCIASIKVQDYPQEKLEVIVIDDGSTDSTVKRIINYATGRNVGGNGNGNGNGNGHRNKKIAKFINNGYINGTVQINGNQYEVPDFKGSIKLLASDNHIGKPEALNTAVENSNGSDILITVDSDVVLEKDALRETAKAFAAKPEMGAATCNIEISWQNMSEIDDDGNPLLDKKGKIVRRKLTLWENILAKCQFMEYVDSFCLGREFQSRVHSTYILAGAFSAFRKSVIKKVHYREATLTEDFDLTIDIHRLNHYIGYVSTAKVYLEPVTDWDHLYSQRVRWHRGQLEVAGLHKEMIGNRKYGKMGWFGFPQMLLGDHTLSFPRLIWTPLILFFGLFGYPFSTIMMALLLTYAFYVVVTMFQTAVAYRYVNEDSRGHVEDTFFYCFLMPFYRVVTFYFRVSGYLLALKEPPRWQLIGPTSGIKEGIAGFKAGIKNGVKLVKNSNGNGNGNGSRTKEKVKVGINVNGKSNGHKKGNGEGLGNGANGVKNGLFVLSHGVKGLVFEMKSNYKRKHAYNNGVDHKDGLRKKDKPEQTTVKQQVAVTAEPGKPFDPSTAFQRVKPLVDPFKIVLSPRNMESCWSEAYYYLHKESFEQAHIPMQEALEFINKAEDLSLLHYEIGKSLFYQRKLDIAWVNLKQAALLATDETVKYQIDAVIKLFPSDYHAPDVQDYVNRAFDCLERGMIFECRDYFRKAINLSTKATDIAYLKLQIARTYYLNDEKNTAKQDFTFANLINKEMGSQNQEFEALEELLSEDTEALTLIDQGSQAFSKEDYPRARNYFLKALSVAKSIDILVNLEISIAKTYVLSNRFEQAKEHLHIASLLDPNIKKDSEYNHVKHLLPTRFIKNDYESLADEAKNYLKQNKVSKSRTCLKLAIEKASNMDELMNGYFELGRLFYETDQKRKARVFVNNALILAQNLGKQEMLAKVQQVLKKLPKYYSKRSLKQTVTESANLTEKGDYENARKCLVKGLALVNDINDLLSVKIELAKIFTLNKQTKKAAMYINEAHLLSSASQVSDYLRAEITSLVEKSPEKIEMNYDLLTAQGFLYLTEQSYKKARKAFAKSISMAANYQELISSYVRIAQVSKELGDSSSLEEILVYIVNLAKVLKLDEYAKKEIKSLVDALAEEKKVTDLDNTINKAYQHLDKKDYRKARAHITAAFAHANTLKGAILTKVELAKMYAVTGQYQRAAVDLNSALTVASEAKYTEIVNEIKELLGTFPEKSINFEAYIRKCEGLLDSNKPKRTLKMCEKAFNFAKRPEDLLRLLFIQGQAKKLIKDNEGARHDLKKALILAKEYNKVDISNKVRVLLAS